MEELTEEILGKIEEIEAKIDEKKKEIDVLYTSLGKYVYEINTPDRDNVIKEVISKIDYQYNAITEYNVAILDLKGFRVCPTCGMEVDKKTMYCGNCGTKMINEIQNVAEGKVCTKCGAVMENDKKFCTRCGAKLDDENSLQNEIQTVYAQPEHIKQVYVQPEYVQPQENICPSCGKVLKPNAIFCSGCGIKLK